MGLKMTLPTLLVIKELRDRPSEEHYGYGVARATGLPGGTVQPILARLEAEGWVTSKREDIDPHKEGRRPRRLYKLTGAGALAATRALAAHAQKLRSADALRPRPAGGVA